MIPASLENQIAMDNAPRIRTKVITTISRVGNVTKLRGMYA